MGLVGVCLVKRLGSDAELQLTGAVRRRHYFRDVWIAFPANDVKVVEGVVLLPVDYVLEGRDLRKIGFQSLEDPFDPLHLIVGNLQDNHYFACARSTITYGAAIGRSYRECAKESD